MQKAVDNAMGKTMQSVDRPHPEMQKCGSEIGSLSGQLPFCPACGRAATTSAWDILLQRLNETESFKQILKENSAML